jgi:hypothetical protein
MAQLIVSIPMTSVEFLLSCRELGQRQGISDETSENEMVVYRLHSDTSPFVSMHEYLLLGPQVPPGFPLHVDDTAPAQEFFSKYQVKPQSLHTDSLIPCLWNPIRMCRDTPTPLAKIEEAFPAIYGHHYTSGWQKQLKQTISSDLIDFCRVCFVHAQAESAVDVQSRCTTRPASQPPFRQAGRQQRTEIGRSHLIKALPHASSIF